MSTSSGTAPDLRAITAGRRPHGTGADPGRVDPFGLLPGELLCEAVDVHPGERVLDVAAGSGAAALAAARRGADVAATELVDHLLVSALRLAEAYGITLSTHAAGAHDLPFDDDAFDVVLSTFGAMFAPDQPAVADELVRVCRPGGRVGMANWAPGSLIGDVLRATDRHVPPPAGRPPALDWGREERIRELFGNRISSIRVETRPLTFRHRSPALALEFFRTGYGPTQVAFDTLDRDGQASLATDLLDVCATHNRADDGTLAAPCGYVEVVAVVR